MRTIFLTNAKHNIHTVYADSTICELEQIAGTDSVIYDENDIRQSSSSFKDVRYIFSTWGIPSFTSDEIKVMFPSLECVFYAAGSVQWFARPFLECGVRVFSAWEANAVPVAEYTVSQIILANKMFYTLSRLMSSGNVSQAKELASNIVGNYGKKIGIIGAGTIGKLVIKMLKAYRLEVAAFDPFLSKDTAFALGVTKCSLEELFSSCQVVSNHLANNDATKEMLNGKLFERMPPYATFINTGRGAQVVESELIAALKARADLTAVLDVTEPEPPVEDSPFFELPNCVLTPHIAGSLGDEMHRMSQYMLEEYKSYIAGNSCRYEVTKEMLETMA